MTDQTLENIKIDADNLWKEENFTDLKVGSIRKITPIKPDGSEDDSRTATFSATAWVVWKPSGPV